MDVLSIGGAIAALWGAWTAHRGLQTWRTQLHGTTEYDLARRTLRHVYAVRDTIGGVRSSLITAGEMRAARQASGADPVPPLGSDADTGLVYDLRWNRLGAARSELNVDLLEAEVHWGDKARELGSALDRQINTLWVALYSYLQEQRQPSFVELSAERVKRCERWREVLWAQYGNPDTFQQGVDAIMLRFEALLGEHLRQRSSHLITRVVARGRAARKRLTRKSAALTSSSDGTP